MNAFSVAEHDLGVQPFHSSVPMDEIERVIHWYSPITKQYELAMESVTVNGQEYTANILSDVKWFHILKGKAPEGKEILVAMLGAVVGTVLSALFSDRLIGMVFRSFGIGEFKTVFCLPGSVIPFLTVPLTFIFFAWIFGKKLKTVNMIGLMEQNGGII